MVFETLARTQDGGARLYVNYVIKEYIEVYLKNIETWKRRKMHSRQQEILLKPFKHFFLLILNYLQCRVFYHEILLILLSSLYVSPSRNSSVYLRNSMNDLRFRKIFNLGITKDISGKKLSKLEKLQSLVAKCCKIRKI